LWFVFAVTPINEEDAAMIVRKNLVGVCVAFAMVAGSAMAAPVNSAVVNTQVKPPVLGVVTQCAAGFTASPGVLKNVNFDSNVVYTCTGPTVVCSPNFAAPNSPVTIQGGRMVYTCFHKVEIH
jgi:hypothetical protein